MIEAFRLDDFDRYVEENEISEDDYPAAFAQWIAQRTGGPVKFEEVVENHEWRTAESRFLGEPDQRTGPLSDSDKAIPRTAVPSLI